MTEIGTGIGIVNDGVVAVKTVIVIVTVIGGEIVIRRDLAVPSEMLDRVFQFTHPLFR